MLALKMRLVPVLAAVVVGLAGCPVAGVVPRTGDYDSVPPEGRVLFRIGQHGMFQVPGNDIDCATTLRGTRLQLDCHGHTIAARWLIAPDGTVSTDAMDVIFGEGDPGLHSYRAR